MILALDSVPKVLPRLRAAPARPAPLSKRPARGTLQNHRKRSFVAWRTRDLLPTFCRTFCRYDDNRPDRFLKYSPPPLSPIPPHSPLPAHSPACPWTQKNTHDCVGAPILMSLYIAACAQHTQDSRCCMETRPSASTLYQNLPNMSAAGLSYFSYLFRGSSCFLLRRPSI